MTQKAKATGREMSARYDDLEFSRARAEEYLLHKVYHPGKDYNPRGAGPSLKETRLQEKTSKLERYCVDSLHPVVAGVSQVIKQGIHGGPTAPEQALKPQPTTTVVGTPVQAPPAPPQAAPVAATQAQRPSPVPAASTPAQPLRQPVRTHVAPAMAAPVRLAPIPITTAQPNRWSIPFWGRAAAMNDAMSLNQAELNLAVVESEARVGAVPAAAVLEAEAVVTADQAQLVADQGGGWFAGFNPFRRQADALEVKADALNLAAVESAAASGAASPAAVAQAEYRLDKAEQQQAIDGGGGWFGGLFGRGGASNDGFVTSSTNDTWGGGILSGGNNGGSFWGSSNDGGGLGFGGGGGSSFWGSGNDGGGFGNNFFSNND